MNQKDLEKKLSFFKLMIPIIIGLAVVSYLFVREFDPEVLQNIDWGKNTLYGFLGILLLVALRFLGYILRLRILTDYKLNLMKSLQVIILWSFGSAISPSAVGGTALAIFILNKEKISLGKSTTIAIATLLLDLIFFVLFSLLIFAILGEEAFFGINKDCGNQIGVQNLFGSYKVFFIVVQIGIVLYLSLIGYAVFINPNTIRKLFRGLFSLWFLKRFKTKALHMVDDLENSSHYFRNRKVGYWLALFGTTMLSWTARFLLVNPVLASFVRLSFLDHLTLYARNFLLWMVMIMPTTPGASGVSEIAISELICEFMPYDSLSPLLILIWRFFDYFLYLILGAIVLPRWIRRVFRKTKTLPT